MKGDINILLIDDEHAFLEQAKIFLEKEEEKMNVITASSAKEGLKLLDKEDFDVIVSDYQMPEMDGLDFLEEVKEKREWDIPFIMFTGKGREEVAMKALNLGAERYLQKGGEPKSQFGVLSNAIEHEYEHYKKEKQFEKSEKEKSIILERTSDAIAYHDSEHNIIWANRSYLEGAGMTLEEMKGKKCYDAWYGRDEPCKGCPTDEALKSSEVKKGEISPPEGEKHWLITATPVKDEEGNVERIIESSLDITDLKEKEDKIKKLYEASTELKDCTSERDIYEKVVRSAEDILGFEGCTILMEDRDELIVKESKAKNVEKGDKYPKDVGISGLTFQKKKSYLTEELSEEERAKPSDPAYKSGISIPIGKEGVFQALSYQQEYFDESDLHLAEILISHLVNSLKQIRSQKELKRETKRYETLFEYNPEAIVEVNDDFEVVQVNEKFEDLFGYEEDEILGKNLKYHIVPEDKIDESNRLGKESEEWNYVEHEAVRLTKDNEEVDVAITARPVEYNGERHHVVVYKDITKQKEKERELKRKEEYIDHTPEYINVLDEKGNIKYHSYPSDDVLEMDPSEFMGAEALEFAHPDDREKSLEIFSKMLENPGEEYRVELRGKGKEDWIWFEIRAVNHLDDPEVEGIIITAQDITKRKEAEEEIKETKERLDLALNGTKAGIWDWYVQTGKTVFNERWAEMVGYELEELEPTDIETWRELAHPEDLKRSEELLEKHFAGENDMYEFEGRMKHKDDHWIWIADRGKVVEWDDEGNPVRMTGTHLDITDRKEAEERQDVLHSILRHDVKNKIQMAKGYVQLMEEGSEGYFDDFMKCVDSAEQLIEKIGTLQKIETSEEMGEIELKNVIDSVIDEHEEQAEKKDIDIEVQNLDLRVKCGSLLNTLFGNLIENSIKHSGCKNIKINGKMEGDKCIVTLEDDGKGISDELKEKIFERGYKKGENAGTGLGMYLVKEIVQSYDGSIEVKDSELGGARIDVQLRNVQIQDS